MGWRSWLVAVVVSCGGLAAQPASTSRPSAPAGGGLHRAFDAVLQATVRDQRIDYLAVRRDHLAQLVGYLDRLATVDPAKLPRDERLALYLNLYNATVIRAVVERFRAGYTPAAHSFALFGEKLVRVAGQRFSLDHLENEILRPQFHDPRIHTALVCGARSCPPLLPRAYRGADLEQVLDANMKRFLNDGERNRIDREHHVLRLSQIFRWYADDFGGEAAVPGYVSRYVDGDLSGYRVEYLEYSWALNVAPPSSGTWVALQSGGPLHATPNGATEATLEAGEVLEVLGRQDGWLHLRRGGGEGWVRAADTAPYRG